MTNTVLLKRSSTANSTPSAGALQYGELALNYADGNLFYKNSSNVVTVIASNQFVSVSGNVTGGNLLTVGEVSASGNVTGYYFIGNGSQLTGVVASEIGTLPSLSVTGNITTGNLSSTGSLSAVGNVSGNYIIGDGSQLTNIKNSGSLIVYSRTGTITIPLFVGGLNVVGRTGNIVIPLAA